MVSTYALEGGLDYVLKNKIDEESYAYEVNVWEKSPSSGDMHSYRTDSQELRMKSARLLLSSKYWAGCKSVDFVKEEPFEVSNHRKRWLNGTWWKLDVVCKSPSNPEK